MIKIQGLTKYYGEKKAVSNLNFNLEDGKIIGLLGLNGSGKTTTIRMLACFLLPSGGDIFFSGESIFKNPTEIKKRIGYLPESPPLYDDFSVREYLEFVSRIKGIPEENHQDEIQRVCEVTSLTGEMDSILSTLSLGFRKRAGIAQAILGNPEILILDEPVSGLDPKQIVEIRKLIRSFSGKMTVLLSSHILAEIYQTCDHFLILREGELVKQYSLSELGKDMHSLSGLEISLSGKTQEETGRFLTSIASGKEVVYEGEESGGHKFLISSTHSQNGSTEIPTNIRQKIVEESIKNGYQVEMLKKQEITLEQIFINRA